MIAALQPRAWPIWDIFFPPLCAACHKPLSTQAVLFCTQCWADAPTADMQDLHKLHHADTAFAGYRYGGDNIVSAAVRRLKYDGMTRLAEVMAQKMLLRMPLRFVEVDVTWVAVPLHWRRRIWRGFNQSALVARELAALTGHDMPLRLLRRTRPTPSQTAQTYRERMTNVKNAFAVNMTEKIPKKILLIDDVITTGATIDECARTLKNAGVEWVGAFAFSLTHTP
jgi:competence protein ComFC